MFSSVGAASVTFKRTDRFQEELLPRSSHLAARDIKTLSHQVNVLAHSVDYMASCREALKKVARAGFQANYGQKSCQDGLLLIAAHKSSKLVQTVVELHCNVPVICKDWQDC